MRVKNGDQRCYVGDFFEVASKLPDNYFQLVFTSPPYFVGKQYEDHDDTLLRANELYQFYLEAFETAYKLTRPGGYIVFNVLETTKLLNFFTKGLDALNYESPHILIRDIMRTSQAYGDGLFCLNFVWDQQKEDTTAWGSFKSPSAVRSRTNHEFVYGFQKKGESMSIGKTDEMTNSEWMEQTRSVISIPTEANRSYHPTPFPVELPEYFIRLLTHKDDPVLDPFAGSCTTLEACRRLQREGWGVELSKSYVLNSYVKFSKLWGKKGVRI